MTDRDIESMLRDIEERLAVLERRAWAPEIGSLWQDRAANVWQCVRLENSPGVLETLMHRLVDNVQASIEEAHAAYGPLVQLVPKEET